MAKMPAWMAMCRWYWFGSHHGAATRTMPTSSGPSQGQGRRASARRATLADTFRPREQPRRPNQQHQDDQEEAQRVAVARRDVAGAQFLGHTEEQPAQGRAAEVAQPTKDD